MPFDRRASRGSRFAVRGSALPTALALLLASTLPAAQPLALVHRQQFSMGTMFDVMVYHASSGDAERAVEKAMAEIARLDEVMSHVEADSDLSRLVREARKGFARAGPDLYAVVQESIRLSRLSGGKFDVTIGPLLKASRKARDENRKPSAKELSEARRCVGSEKVELAAPDGVRFHSECLEIDLGGIGKGYAVDRAMQVLASAGVRHAMINAGSSSIASVGSPPDREGWPVKLGPEGAGSPTLLLQNASVSTSQQDGNILDPFTGAPTNLDSTVSVIAPTATASDALSTTLVMLSTDEAKKLLAEFADVSAFWLSPAGTLRASFRESRVRLSDSR